MPDNRHYMNPADDHTRVQTARQAAEALFKPKQRVAQTVPEATAPSSPEPNLSRTPRILSATPVIGDPAQEAELVKRPTDPRRTAPKVPKSAHGRIRALTTHGMTTEDVAALYGVPVTEIARIVSV